MALWRPNYSEHGDHLSSLQPTGREPTRLSASELRRSIGRRSFQGVELISAFHARFPGRPAQPTPNMEQPVVFNVNIFDTSPLDTATATETKVSSIESLHRYAQYTGRYPKLGLFDYFSEDADEDAEGEDDMDQESEYTGMGDVSELEGEDLQPLHQEILGYDAVVREEPRDHEILEEETHQDIHKGPSNGRGRSKSIVALESDEVLVPMKSPARVRSSVPEPKPETPIKRPTMGGKTTFALGKIATKPQRKAPKRFTFDCDDLSESSFEEEDDEEGDDDAYIPSFDLSPITSTSTPSSSSSSSASPNSRKRKRGAVSQAQRDQTTAAGSSDSNSAQSYKVVTERSGKLAYECLLCPNFRTKAVGDMMRHLESLIHKDRSYACDFAGCESLFTRKDALVRHKKLVHDPSRRNKHKKAKPRKIFI